MHIFGMVSIHFLFVVFVGFFVFNMIGNFNCTVSNMKRYE